MISVHKGEIHFQNILEVFNMANSRAMKRAGFSVLIGALNPQIIVSQFKPFGSKFKHGALWLDISVTPAVWRWFDSTQTPGSEWTL